MRTVNNSQGKPYFTQRNNQLSPGAACNVTAMVAALAAAGWPFPPGAYAQPEDNLMAFIRGNQTILRRWDVIDPRHSNPPNEWHELLCLGANLWLAPFNGPAIKLYFDLHPEDIVRALDRGGAVVVSGRFKTAKSDIGHIVPIVGYRAGDAGATHFILDDTWGDYRTLYETVNGNDILMPLKDFIPIIRPAGEVRKLGHAVPRFTGGNAA